MDKLFEDSAEFEKQNLLSAKPNNKLLGRSFDILIENQ
jgi:hypothetical protein